ncbi:5731_t:CDS:2 [Diversispora eburnea]|uniref:5731_t:CDS:1 n=1 Tax=Diversispora eburnea TaxID=1213867 RepID=A0A9N9BHN1_9GLOM|nr:5731_t:CDS:2 [Diversispora eburnea]
MSSSSPTTVEIHSSSSSIDSKSIQVLNEEAIKAFILQDFATAADKFSNVSELVGKFYGLESEEYAEALYNYGHSLLENFRIQNTALGPQAIPQESSTETPSENVQANSSYFVFEGDDDDSDDQIDDADNQVDGSLEQSGEEPDDLKLAWEILEYSRDIYSQLSTESAKINLGEVYIKLGDISLENEKFDQAAIDYREGLKIKKETLSEDNRQIAEAYPFFITVFLFERLYRKLALALESIPDINNQDEAIQHVQKATEVLQKRKEILLAQLTTHQERTGKGKQVATAEDPTISIEKEIKDIDELLVEMETKIEDIKTSRLNQEQKEPKSSELALKEYVKLLSTSNLSELASEEANISLSSVVNQVNDVTSLIKRKLASNNSPNENNLSDEISIQEIQERKLKQTT